MVHRPPLMAATVAAAAHAGLRGGGSAGGGDRGSIYRNGDLYIVRRGLCIASTHPVRSSPSLPVPPLTADLRRRERTAPHCERSRVGSWVRGGCRGAAGAVVRHGSVVRGAGRFNETRPHHPLRAGRARLLVRRNASPIQLPVLKAHSRARGRRMRRRFRCGTRRHRFQQRPSNVASWYNRNQDRFGFRGRGFDFSLQETLSYSENINALTLNKR